MDVRCEKCGTVYDLDEAQLTDAGVTVRCTECDNVFRVKRRSVAFTEPVSVPAPGVVSDKPWQIRTASGDVYTFKDLTTLQKWIVERKVSRDDEISRSGETWKRLGNIAELATFFQVVDQANAIATGATSPAQPAAIEPPSPAPSAAPPPAAAPAAVASAPPASPFEAGPPAAIAPSAEASFGAPAEGGGSEGSFYDYEDEDDFAEFRQGGGAGKWIVILLVLLGGGVGAFYFLAPEKFQEITQSVLALVSGDPAMNELVLSHLQSGEKALKGDTLAGFAEAETQYQKAIELAGDSVPVEAKAGLAETYVAWGVALRELAVPDPAAAAASPAPEKESAESPAPGSEGADEKAEPPKEAEKVAEGEAAEAGAKQQEAAAPAPPGDPALLADSKKKLEAAFTAAREAMQADGSSLFALRAMAGYYAAMGAPDKLGPLVDQAKAVPGSDKDAGLAWAQGFAYLGDTASLDSAIRHLQSAVERDAGLMRARYHLAVAYLAQGETKKAEVHAKKVLETSPSHERGKALAAKIDAILNPPEPEPEPASEESAPEPEPPPKPKPLGFDGLLNKAFKLRDRGQVEKALDLYGQARDLKPERAEPYAGQGLCYLEMRAWPAAQSSFEQALKKNPRYGDALIGMAEAYKYRGKKDKAKEFYQRYLDVLPNGPESNVAKTFLANN